MSRDQAWRLGAAVVLGGAGALGAYLLGIPGSGLFVPVVWLSGLAASLIAPSIRGFLSLAGGAAVVSALADLVDGSFGLVLLVAGIVTALAAHGALAGWVLSRGRSLGPSRAYRDGPFALAAAFVLATIVMFAWLAREFAANPA
jgi:hypothetical protein